MQSLLTLNRSVLLRQQRLQQSRLRPILLLEASAFYGKSVSSLTQVFEGVPAAQTHSIAINNLDSNDRYYYQLKAEDESGVFTINYLQFITLPEIPANLRIESVESIQNNNVNIVWDPVSGRKHYNIYLDGQLPIRQHKTNIHLQGLSTIVRIR